MAGQVESVDRTARSERLVIEKPVVEVAAETVDENRCLAAVATFEVTHGVAFDLDGVGSGTRELRLGILRHEVGLKIGHEGVDFSVGDGSFCDDREQSRHRHDIPHRRHVAAQDTAGRRFDRAGDFFRLDLDQLYARHDLGSLFGKPVDDLAFFHGEAPLGHRQFVNRHVLTVR